MTTFQSIAILLAVAACSSWVNHRYLKLSSAIGVMIVSLVVSLALILLGYLGCIDPTRASSYISSIDFEHLLLHGMLAFLLFAGALTVRFSDLSSERVPVAMLSTIGVTLSTFGAGALYWIVLGWFGLHIPFIMALLFGAIVSPTDAVAVLGILRKVGAPKSLETKVVGESLFNDGVGVVIFLAISSVAFGREISTAEVALSLTLEVFGGVLLGISLGWIVFLMCKAVDDYVVEILLTLALAAGGYAVAESLHVSAPIFAVVSGLIIGNQGREFAMTERTREHLDTFWELIDELLNAILFVLIGLEIFVLSAGIPEVLAGCVGIGAVLLSRVVSVWLPISFLSMKRTFEPRTVAILSWGGLKGGISVALALSLPPGEYRELIVVSTYVVVLFSVIVQGATLPLLFAKRGAA